MATTKKVPGAGVVGEPCVRKQADDLKRPPGFDEIVQEEESPLLNVPAPKLIKTVDPGGPPKAVTGGRPEKVSIGVASTMKVSVADAPLLEVTVTVMGPGVAPEATLNEAVILPELMLQVGAGDPAKRVAEAVIVQVGSRLGKPVPVTVMLVPTGPSDGLRKIAGPEGGGATVKVAEAKSPKVPFTVTV